MDQSFDLLLRKLGADTYDLWLPESHALPGLLNTGEQMKGIVYGKYAQSDGSVGRGMLVATNRRVILLDKKPLFVHSDEIGYQVVSAITHTSVGPIDVITLHTRMGDIKIRTFNKKCAQGFTKAVEDTILNNYPYKP